MNLITKAVEFDIKGSGDQVSRKVRKRPADLHPENAGEALGKPRGFGWRDVGARSPQIELSFFFLNCNLYRPVNVASY